MKSGKAKTQRTNFLYIALFVLTGIASAIILHHNNSQRILTAGNTGIDSFAHHATLTEYDKSGEVKSMITAETAIHSQPDGITHFKNPYIATFTKDKTPWHIRADKGTSDKDGNKILLKQNVVIHQLPTKNRTETRITTSELTIFTKDSRAVTDKPVTLSRPGMTLYGVGLSANFKTGEYQLLSQSKAVYQPSNKRN